MRDRVKLARVFLKEDFILKHSTVLSVIDNLVFKFISIGSKRRIIQAYSEYKKGAGVPKNVASLITYKVSILQRIFNNPSLFNFHSLLLMHPN